MEVISKQGGKKNGKIYRVLEGENKENAEEQRWKISRAGEREERVRQGWKLGIKHGDRGSEN